MLSRVPRIGTRSCKNVLKNGSALRLERMPIPGTEVNIYCDTSTPQPRQFITTLFSRQVFHTPHGQHHRQVGVPAVFVAGSRERLPRLDTRVYTLPTFHGATARIGPSRKFQLAIGTYFSCAYRHGRPTACLLASGTVSLPSKGTPVGLRHSLSLRSPPKQSLRPSSPSGLLVSAVPSKSQPTRRAI